jgi:hypothetical protein
MHDFLEKVASCDGAAILSAFISEGKFTLEEYNRQLMDLRLAGYENSDRPSCVPARCEKLPGKALSVALHIRMMPYLLFRLGMEYEESDLLNLLLLIHKINEYLQADTVNLSDTESFEDLLVVFFEKRKICSEKYSCFKKMTPKYHFLEHYKEQMERFGPLNSYWTARAEGKHRIFVNFAESAKNFINITKTLVVKHQKLLCTR